MPLDRRELARVLCHMTRAAGLDPDSVDLTVTDDADISAVNAHFLGCRGPTNIVSFPALATAPAARCPDGNTAPVEQADNGFPDHGRSQDSCHEDPVCGGQLLLSEDTLLREARLYGQDPAQHAVRLLAHGLAHLAGYDHGPDLDRVQHLAEQAGLQALADRSAPCLR